MADISFSYSEIPLEDCLDLGTRLIKEECNVHFHVLSPGCILNPRPSEYAFVIEDNSENITYLAFSETFPEVDKQLTQLQFGDSILDEASSRLDETGFAGRSSALSQILKLQKNGKTWHHHMHFPNCVMNPEKGKWAISIEENGPDGKVTVETYDQKPTDVLREIEILYFRNLEK